jgi:predicted transport protein
MKEKTIKINTNISLPDVVSAIRKGQWKIPRFQREFVWEKKKVIELLDSIYRGFPIGSFFLWIPPEEYSQYYKDIPELKIEHGNQKFYTHFILDGQQRLTSLYVTYQGLEIDGYDYSNICFNLDTEEFNTDKRDTERNLPLHEILNVEENIEIYNQLTDERKRKYMQAAKIFSDYPFPVITIEDKNIEEACKIFERINQGGKRLSIFDLVVAVTWDKDFELKKKIDEFNKKIENTFGKIDPEVFTETLSLIINKQCTKAFQIKLTPSDVKDNWPKVEDAIGKSIQFLRTHLKVKSYKYLPYRDMLALIAYYFYYSKKTEIDKTFIELWFWKAAFSNRYSGSSFTKIGEDRAYIFDEVLRGEAVDIRYDINIDVEKILNVNMGRDTAFRNALILIMIQQQPLSFIDNSPIDIEKDPISEFNSSEKHHIFPKKYLHSVGIKEQKATDLLVNFCLIDSILNKSISGNAPNEYFTRFRKNNPELKKALDSHLIPSGPDSGIWSNDYKIFIRERAELLLIHIKKRVGDINAAIEDQMNSNPSALIHKLEQDIRETINAVLYEERGEDWWMAENVVPQDIKQYAAEKIKREKMNKPYINEQEWNIPSRKLEQLNIMDYLKIILKNWNHFENIFGSKNRVEQNFDGFATIRNQIEHVKTLDPLERKMGEAAIGWIYRCIQRNNEKSEQEERGGPFLVNEIYESLKKRIIDLDPEIQEKEQKYFRGFNKKNKMFHFAVVMFRRDCILVRLLVPKGKLNDPKLITKDKTAKEDREKRKIFFEIKSNDELDYAMELIKQAYQYNEQYINKQKPLMPRHFQRYEFWKQLLEKAKEKNLDFANLSPTYAHWISKGSGKAGVPFSFVIAHGFASIEVYIDTGNKEANKRMFDYLHDKKEVIEKKYGEDLLWERLDSKRACRISYRFEGVGLKHKELLSDLQDRMIDKMFLIEKAIKDLILDFK